MVAEYCGQRQEYHALNEVFVTKGRNIRPVYLQVTLNEEHFTNTKGDGLIVSTPTGSTAYALSAGGPILSQEARSILLVPVSPLSLSFRPVILPDSTNIKI
jgi:NAD kinase